MEKLTCFEHWTFYGSQMNYGGFQTAILKAYQIADKGNKERLNGAFPHLFQERCYDNKAPF